MRFARSQIPTRGQYGRQIPRYYGGPIRPRRIEVDSKRYGRPASTGNAKVQPIRKLDPMEARKLFVQWFKRHEPFYYRVAEKVAQIHAQQRGIPLSGLGAIDWGGIFSSIGKTVQEAVPAAIQYKQQKDLMKMQMKRAEQGLPPANVEDYTPAVKISPHITPETEQAISRVAIQTASSGINKLLIPLAIGGGVLLLVMRRRR